MGYRWKRIIEELCDKCEKKADYIFKYRSFFNSYGRTYCKECLTKELKRLGLEK